MRNRIVALVILVGGIALLSGAVAVNSSKESDLANSGNLAGTAPSLPAIPVQTAAVTRGNLEDTKEFRAAVGFADPWPVNTTATGTVTRSRQEGELVGFGQWLVYVDEKPLVVAEGDLPLYRDLFRVRTSNSDKLLRGDDVAQLQRFLLAEGYDDNERLEANGVFSFSTERALEAWQGDNGHDDDGVLRSDQLVFSPDEIRVAEHLRVGTTFRGLAATEPRPTVTIETSPEDRAAVAVDTPLELEIPDGGSLSAVVVEQNQVGAADGSAAWRSILSVAGVVDHDLTTVKAIVTQSLAEDVILVPTAALLALAEGGFALELKASDGSTSLVGVQVGEVLGAIAEVSTEDPEALSEGDRVVIAT